MRTVSFIGDKAQSAFAVCVPVVLVQDMLQKVLDGKDPEFEAMIKQMGGIEAECIDAMGWEEDTFVKNMIKMFDDGGRFAIGHGDLTFGASVDSSEANAAYLNKEF